MRDVDIPFGASKKAQVCSLMLLRVSIEGRGNFVAKRSKTLRERLSLSQIQRHLSPSLVLISSQVASRALQSASKSRSEQGHVSSGLYLPSGPRIREHSLAL